MGDKVRHTTERGSRSGGQIPRYRLPQASVGYDNLTPALRRDVTASRMAARAVQAEKKVWDRARAITEQGTFLVEKLEGLISEAQLEQAVRETLDKVPVVEGMLADVTGRVETAEASIEDLGDQIALKADKSVLDAVAQRVTTAEARLDVLADEISAKVSQEDFDLLAGRVSTAEATLQIHAGEIAAKASQQEVDLLADRVTQAEADIVATAGLIQSEVSRIEGRLGSSDPSVWYSSIKQTADEIESVVAMLNSDAQATGQFSSIKQTADAIDFVVSTLNEAPDAPTQFSSIKQTVQEISSIVALLNSDPDAANQFSAITQLASEIDLRVHKDEVITAINLSPEGVKIQANKIEFMVDGAYDADGFPIKVLDNQIWIDSTGLNMQNVAVQNKLMNLNAHRLAFWDADGEVVAGMGNIDDLIQQLDPGAVVPGMGVLIAQGAFLATQGVLRDALADFSVSREKLEGGSIAREHLTDGVVGFVNLAKDLSVADTQTFIRSAIREDHIQTRTSTQWASYLSYDYGDDLVENIRIDYNATCGSGTGYVRVLVNGQVVYIDAWTGNRGVQSIYIDLRSVDSPHVDFQWRFAASGGAMSVWWAVINRNARYAIVPAPPSYYVEQSEVGCMETCEVSCQSTCEERCESSCQRSCQKTCEQDCQTSCQGLCQTSCQVSCQSTCQKRAQGGCFVDGTPVTVYDPETGEISEIPIEELKPGMFMPYYDPQTDRVMISECVSNEPSITATLYEITVEAPNEPIVLRATPEQPFDVWRKNRLTGEWGWSVIRAQYLKPGDKMIRPFDEQNRMPNVISVVKLPPQPPTRVWDPTTVARRYIVAGFADAFSKH